MKVIYKCKKMRVKLQFSERRINSLANRVGFISCFNLFYNYKKFFIEFIFVILLLYLFWQQPVFKIIQSGKNKIQTDLSLVRLRKSLSKMSCTFYKQQQYITTITESRIFGGHFQLADVHPGPSSSAFFLQVHNIL